MTKIICGDDDKLLIFKRDVINYLKILLLETVEGEETSLAPDWDTEEFHIDFWILCWGAVLGAALPYTLGWTKLLPNSIKEFHFSCFPFSSSKTEM